MPEKHGAPSASASDNQSDCDHKNPSSCHTEGQTRPGSVNSVNGVPYRVYFGGREGVLNSLIRQVCS